MLRIPISPSRLMAASLLLVHGLAAACVHGFAPAWGWSLAGLLALAASLAFHARRDALLLARDAITGIVLHDDGGCDLLTRDGGEMQGRVMETTFVSTALIVINVRLDSGRSRSALLLPDSAAAEDRRRLRVWLRHAMRLKETGSAGL